MQRSHTQAHQQARTSTNTRHATPRHATRHATCHAPRCNALSEERLAALIEVAPWRLCANKRGMSLPPEAAAKLPWGLLAGGSWWRRRPSRWLKVRG
jgi:hypothetical protein